MDSLEEEPRRAKDAIVDNTWGAISQLELSYGMYWWGNKETKKEGTPDDWVYRHEGTRSASWCKPGNSAFV